MIDHLNLHLLENGLDRRIPKIDVVKFCLRVYIFNLSRGKIIDNNNSVSSVEIRINDVGADKSGSAGNENIHNDSRLV